MSKPGAALRAAGWVTVGVIAAGGVATAATTGGSTNQPTGTTPAAVSTHAKAAGHGKHGRLGKVEHRLLHGQFTVLGKHKQPVVVAEQRGTVNEVSSTSIKLTSKDGVAMTYTVNPQTRVRVDGKKSAIGIGSVKTDQPAAVLAKVESDGQQTATIVVQRAAR